MDVDEAALPVWGRRIAASGKVVEVARRLIVLTASRVVFSRIVLRHVGRVTYLRY